MIFFIIYFFLAENPLQLVERLSFIFANFKIFPFIYCGHAFVDTLNMGGNTNIFKEVLVRIVQVNAQVSK